MMPDKTFNSSLVFIWLGNLPVSLRELRVSAFRFHRTIGIALGA